MLFNKIKLKSKQGVFIVVLLLIALYFINKSSIFAMATVFKEDQVDQVTVARFTLDMNEEFESIKVNNTLLELEGEEGTDTTNDIKTEEFFEKYSENSSKTALLDENDEMTEAKNENDITESESDIVSNDILLAIPTMQKFLNTSSKFFTLNVTTGDGFDSANYMIKKYNISDNGYTFKYGKGELKVKVLYGTYATYQEAKSALANLNLALVERHNPYIDSVNKHQELYRKYN